MCIVESLQQHRAIVKIHSALMRLLEITSNMYMDIVFNNFECEFVRLIDKSVLAFVSLKGTQNTLFRREQLRLTRTTRTFHNYSPKELTLNALIDDNK